MEQLFSQWGPASTTFWVRAIWAVVVFIVIAAYAGLARRGVVRGLLRARVHAGAILLLGRITQLTFVVIGALVALGILGIDLSALAAVTGLGAVAITLTLQDITRNYVAGLYLLIERPFNIGDTVQVTGEQGIIENVGIRTTTLRTDDGDRVIVPNTVLLTNIVTQRKITKV